MPVIQKLVDFNEAFKQLKEEPIIINDLMRSTNEEREYIENLVKSKFGNDMLSTIPSCQCGHLKGEYAIGEKCPKCRDKVKTISFQNIEPILWVRRPIGVNKLISPFIWYILNTRFSKGTSFSLLRWVTDTGYRPIDKQAKIIDEAESLGITRGYNNFIDHFEEYLHKFFQIKSLSKSKLSMNDDILKDLIFSNIDKILCDYLPLPNKALLIITQNNLGTWLDKDILLAIDAISMLTSIDTEYRDQPQRVKENKTVRALHKLTEFYEITESDMVSGKPGVFRKHVFGCRTYFSGRAVITSITKPHDYEQIELPWSIGITILRPMIINKLLKRGYDLNQAIGFINSNVTYYNPMLDRIIDELIDESRDKKLYCILHRNPTLLQASAQRFNFIVKKDPRDPTIGMSILTVVGPNADFDGDPSIL